jgi:hypothetical protein|tara:strand:- start:520 stop:831 length:312 start_codon:yes stop_codon:yes gene_type:complete
VQEKDFATIYSFYVAHPNSLNTTMRKSFKEQARELDAISARQNARGFQEKSGQGPRQGVGGEESPMKMKKNFYGGDAYFADGYGGDLTSPAKAMPITQKAKSK